MKNFADSSKRGVGKVILTILFIRDGCFSIGYLVVHVSRTVMCFLKGYEYNVSNYYIRDTCENVKKIVKVSNE